MNKKDVQSEKMAEVRNKSVDNSAPKITSEKLQSRALESEEAIKQGEFTTFVDLKDEMQAW